MVEKSPITCVLWPSVWCASPGTSPGTCVGFSCSSDGCAQPLTRTARAAGARRGRGCVDRFLHGSASGRAGAAATRLAQGGRGRRDSRPPSYFWVLEIVTTYDTVTFRVEYVHGYSRTDSSRYPTRLPGPHASRGTRMD